MKKIFYSMMAVALCACSQSDVDDNVVAPQPENNGLKFTVVDNGFVNEDGTRVTYDGITASFGENDEIGIFAIKTSGNMEDDHANLGPDAGAKVPNANAYIVNNAKLTYSGGVWKLTDKDGNTGVDFGDADLLFAYRPYDPNKTINSASGEDGRPSFVQASDGSWDINKGNNRFFVHPWNKNWETPTEADFANADWMGAAANITSETKTVTLNMTHMRGMVELTTDKNVKLAEMLVGFGKNASGNKFVPYFANENDNSRTKNIYRILTTEYRNALTIYAKIEDDYIVKKYKLVIDKDAAYKKAGVRYLVNIDYTPVETITVGTGEGESLASQLGSTQPTKLRLAGTLSDADWTTLQGLALTSLDMYQLKNTSIPDEWMKNAATLKETLTSLVLPNGLTTIGGDALQFGASKVISIDLPASVTTIGNGAFYNNQNMSICIPEDSQLETIGQGAFLNVQKIHTDPASENVLKIPASVTKIDVAAFGGSGLTKVIFQSATAPEIVNGGYAVTFNESVKVVVPNNSYKGKFTAGMTVFVGPGLTAKDYSTPYTFVPGSWPDGIGLAGLCDGVTASGKHWHSKYSGTYDEWGIYIDITLPTKETGYNPLTVSYTTRFDNGNGAPTKVRMAVSNDGETFTQVGEDFTTTTLPGGNETITLDPITVGTNKYVRFAILEAKGVSVVGETGQSANLAELTLYEETWTE